MEDNITFTFSRLQVLLSLAFQLWIIVFPIILIRKLNYLTSLIQDQGCPDSEAVEPEER